LPAWISKSILTTVTGTPPDWGHNAIKHEDHIDYPITSLRITRTILMVITTTITVLSKLLENAK
jgi:hypothetical protein